MKHYLLFLGVFLLSNTSFAQEECNSGNEKQRELLTQLKEASQIDPSVANIIFKNYKLNETEASLCTECGLLSHPLVQKVNGIKASILRYPQAPQLAFREECFLAANKNKSSTAEVSCQGDKVVRSGNTNMCITKSFLKYQNAVISNFASCAKSIGFEGIDITSIYEKLSLESTFKPNFSSNDGLGLGQLTSIFIKDVHQGWRGQPFMKKIADSKLPECSAAKIIAGKDLKAQPQRSDICSFVKPGEGLERNFLYSLIGIETVWKKNLEPKLKKYLAQHKDNPKINDVKKLVQMTAYGRGGMVEARAALKRLEGLPPDAFVKVMNSPMTTTKGSTINNYTAQIFKRQKEIAERLPANIKNEFAKVGANACLTTF